MLEAEEWVVFTLKNFGEEVFCEPRADWDGYLRRMKYTKPPSHMTLLATGLTKETAMKMKELANGY